MVPPAPLPPRLPVRLLTREYTFLTAGMTVVMEAVEVPSSDEAFDADRPKGRRRAAGLASSSPSLAVRRLNPPACFREEDGVTRWGVPGVRRPRPLDGGVLVLAASASLIRERLVGLENGDEMSSSLASPRLADRGGERAAII